MGQDVGEDSPDRNVGEDSGLQSQFKPFYLQKGKVTESKLQEKVSDDKAILETAMEKS